MPMATADRTREFRLRREASARGLRLTKSRAKRWPPGRGWSLAALDTGKYTLGTHLGGASLDEVEAFLNTPDP